MTLAENKALVRRFVEEIFVQGRIESVDYDQIGMLRQLGAMPG
jgi:hypothetical protein